MYNLQHPIVIGYRRQSELGINYKQYALVNNDTEFVAPYFIGRLVGRGGRYEFDIRNVIEHNRYRSEYSLQPIFNNTHQYYSPNFIQPGNAPTLPSNSINQYWMIGISDMGGGLLNPIYRDQLYVTSSRDLREEMPSPQMYSTYILPLTYRTHVTPRYPNAVTDKYGIYMMYELNGHPAPIGPINRNIYIYDDPDAAAERRFLLVNQSDLTRRLFHQTTLPYNITLKDFFEQVVPVFTTGSYVEDNTITGGAATNFADTITGGSATNFADTITAGDAVNAGREDIPYSFSGDVYSGTTPQKIATIDDCNSKYYLAWQTHSGAPFSWGFDGNTVKGVHVNNNTITNYKRFERVTGSTSQYKFELRSGVVSEDVYDLFADIFDSPYLYLYSVEEDRAWYVNINDTDFMWKTRKAERTPLNITLNLEEAEIH